MPATPLGCTRGRYDLLILKIGVFFVEAKPRLLQELVFPTHLGGRVRFIFFYNPQQHFITDDFEIAVYFNRIGRDSIDRSNLIQETEMI